MAIRLTESHLRQIIREEASRLVRSRNLREAPGMRGALAGTFTDDLGQTMSYADLLDTILGDVSMDIDAYSVATPEEAPMAAEQIVAEKLRDFGLKVADVPPAFHTKAVTRLTSMLKRSIGKTRNW